MADCLGQLRVEGTTNPYILGVPGSASFGPGTDLAAGRIVISSWSRAYLADACGPIPSSYGAWQLLGRTFSFTVQLSTVGCGCNLAVYTGAMRQNTAPGTCWGGSPGLHYCDANAVCGVRCDEIDIMEANRFAFHSVAHQYWDGGGAGGGFGGSHGHPGGSYGPGSNRVIDTTQPFRVVTSFDTSNGGSSGTLSSITTALEQQGRRTSWSMAPSSYLAGLDASTRAGLTIVLSFWSSGWNGMSWLDRPPCADYGAPSCNSATLSDFALSGGDPPPPPPLPHPPPPPVPAPSPPPPPQCLAPGAALPTSCQLSVEQMSVGAACACQYVWTAGCEEPTGTALVCEA